jgi:hypothetical protein
MEIPKGGHRLSLFISYSTTVTSESDDDAYPGSLALIIL